VDYGQSASRFVEPKVHKPKSVDLGPRIMLDDERCILCSRCIRFTKDNRGDDAAWHCQSRSYNTLAAYPGKAFDNNYTLNTVTSARWARSHPKIFVSRCASGSSRKPRAFARAARPAATFSSLARGKNLPLHPRENDAVNGPWMCDAAG